MPYCSECRNVVQVGQSFCTACGKPTPSYVSRDAHEELLEREAVICGCAEYLARDLPEMDTGFLVGLIGWCVDVRGERPLAPPEMMHIQEMLQRAAIKSGVKEPPLDDVHGSFAFLLLKERLSFREAWLRYCKLLERGEVRLAPTQHGAAALAELREQLLSWLRRRNIWFSAKPPVRVPVHVVSRLLQPYANGDRFYLSPGIPRNIAETVVQSCVVVEGEENCAAVIDCTFWGSAEKAVVFGSKAAYWNDGVKRGFVPYSELAERPIVPDQVGTAVSLGDGQTVLLSYSGLSPLTVAAMLEAVRDEIVRRVQHARSPAAGVKAVPGMAGLKQMLIEDVIQPFTNPDLYARYKIEIPAGVLLYGPPGCGKTYIARALAQELHFSFHEISPGDVASVYVHGTVELIRQVFDAAAASAPAILFVDEFEGLVPARSELGGHQQYKAEEVNEWLIQIGKSAARRILVIAATNEPWKIDPAIRRTGRFDKKVYVGPPDEAARAEILRHYLDSRPVAAGLDVDGIAVVLSGYASSDLKALVDEAAREALRERTDIGIDHLFGAMEKVPASLLPEQEAIYKEFTWG